MSTEYVEHDDQEDNLPDEEFVEEEIVDEEGSEPDDSDEGESDGPEVIEADSDFAIEVPIQQLDGTFVEQVLDSDTLSHLVSKGTHYDSLLKHAEEYQRQAQQSKALVDFVAGDPILARMTYMRANGYSQQDILNDIQQLMTNMNHNQNTDPYLDELDDHQRQIYLKVKEEESKRMQLEQQLASLQQERMVDTVANHNSKVFDDALAESGLDYTGNADIPKIQQAIAELYPHIDPRTTKFTKQQAKAILANAGLRRRGSKTSAKIDQVNKAKMAPRVIGGSKSSGTNKRPVQPKIGSGIEERRKALQALGF